jgi:hypothetical protein
MLVLPPPLQPGDRLCVVAPSGALRELEALQKGIEIWRSRGYEIELMPGPMLSGDRSSRQLGRIQTVRGFSVLAGAMAALDCWKTGIGLSSIAPSG